MRHSTLVELAGERGIRLPAALTEDWPPRLSGTDERGWFRFQRLYDTARSVLRRPGDVRRLLTEIPGVICPEPQGAFYCYPSVKGLLGKEIAGQRPQTSAELASVILDEAEVAVVPGEAFGTPGYFRMSYALGDADLEEGVTRIGKLLADAR